MESDWFSVLDRIDDFNLERAKSPKAWSDWFTQYKILLRATAYDRLRDEQKVALLLTKCKGFKHVLEVLSIDEDTIEYDALVAKLNNYFTPVYARNAFFSRQKEENETFEEFAKALKALSLPCHFVDSKIVRDAFVLNMNNDTIARQILIAGDPSLEEALHRAKFFAHEPESNGSHSDLATEEPSDIFSPKYTFSIASTKMSLITEGTHSVVVIGIERSLVFVVPADMIHARDIFLDELQRLMKGRNEPEATPLQGCSYSVLVNYMWYRVIVTSIESGKKARVESIDFGWTRLLPFSVFRNTPLDCRVVGPLLWTVSFRHPVPAQVLPGAHLKVSLTQVNNNWIASLVETTGTNKCDFRQSLSPYPSREDHSVNKPSHQHSDNKNASGGHRDGLGATEDYYEKRRLACSETRQRDVGRGVHKNSTEPRKSGDNPDSDCSERPRGQRDSRSRDGNNHKREEQFKRNSQEKDCGFTSSESARNNNPPDNRFRGQGGVNRNAQEKDYGPTSSESARNDNPLDNRFRGQGGFNRSPQEKDNAGSIRARNDNSINNPFRGQGDNFTRNQQESDNWSNRSHQSRNGNPLNQPFRTGDRHVGGNNQPRNGNPPNDRPFRGQGDSERNSRESDDGFSQSNQSQNAYPPSNRPSRGQGGSNRNSEVSDSEFIRNKQPRNGNPPNNRPSRGQGDSNRNSDVSDNEFIRNNHPRNGPNNRPSRGQGDSNRNSDVSENESIWNKQPRNGNPQGPGRRYPCAPTSKPVSSSHQPGFTPRPVELRLAENASHHKASAQPEHSDEFASPRPPPIPLGQFTDVSVTSASASGDVFCTLKDKAVELGELTEELRRVRCTVLSDPRKDMWCLVENEGGNYRAEIFRVHPSGKRFRVRLFDFGEELVRESQEIMVLPQKYHTIPPYAFGIKLPEGVCAAEGDHLKVKPVFEDGNGVWLVEVDGSAIPTQPAQSTWSPTPPRRPQLPPIPKNTYSEVRVMYTGPEGIFVVQTANLEVLSRIQDQILEVPKTPIKGLPGKGGLYIAPYDGGEFYRAQVLSVDGHNCVVSFVDFGNQAEVRASDLIQLPKSLQGNVHTFKVTLDRDSGVTLTDGLDVRVTPLIMENGAWLVQVEEEPTYPNLPDDSGISFNQD